MRFVEVKTPVGTRALQSMRNRRLPSPPFREDSNKLTQEIVSVVRRTHFASRRKGKRKKVIGVFILRAGLAFFGAAERNFPTMRFGFVGLRRHEKPGNGVRIERYCWNVPIDPEAIYYIFDPMLATGKSMKVVIARLIKAGVPAEQIIPVVAIAAPEALALLESKPWGEKIVIYGAALDERLDENFFIVPGLGDYGDRYFETEALPKPRQRRRKAGRRRKAKKK